MVKSEQLKKLEQKIINDDVTPELANQATQLVFGTGSADADIVFIGEAPGKNEDLKGDPFVGAAGKFLDEMLDSVGIKRSDVYITNIVKYRPPNNRDPLPEEKEEFWPYLLKQISIIRPKIIATLGRHSGQVFIKDLHISADHGKPRELKVIYPSKVQDGDRGDAMQGDDEQQTEPYLNTEKGVAESSTKQRAPRNNSDVSSADGQVVSTITVLPLYHPAAALYNGGLRQTLLDDFAVVKDLLKEN